MNDGSTSGFNVTVPFSRPANLYGSTSVSGSAPINSFEWDFGDGQKAVGSPVEHTFNKSFSDAYPVLRVNDKNGFISDTYIHLQNGKALLTHPQRFIQNKITHLGSRGKILFQGLIGLGAIIILYAVVLLAKAIIRRVRRIRLP